MLLIWWLLVSGGSGSTGEPLTKSQNAFDLVAYSLRGSRVDPPPGAPRDQKPPNAFDFTAFEFWGLPGRPGSPYYVPKCF